MNIMNYIVKPLTSMLSIIIIIHYNDDGGDDDDDNIIFLSQVSREITLCSRSHHLCTVNANFVA